MDFDTLKRLTQEYFEGTKDLVISALGTDFKDVITNEFKMQLTDDDIRIWLSNYGDVDSFDVVCVILIDADYGFGDIAHDKNTAKHFIMFGFKNGICYWDKKDVELMEALHIGIKDAMASDEKNVLLERNIGEFVRSAHNTRVLFYLVIDDENENPAGVSRVVN